MTYYFRWPSRGDQFMFFWRNQGKSDDARKLLASVYGRFTEGFDTPNLKQVKALLDELAA